MKFIIDKKEINRDIISYREMGFGEDIPSPIKYEFEVPFDVFFDKSKNEINEFIEECRVDDAEHGGLEINELVELAYPEADVLAKDHPDILAVLIKKYFREQLFEWLFDDNPEEQWQYVINSVDHVEINNNILVFSGDCYSVQTE